MLYYVELRIPLFHRNKADYLPHEGCENKKNFLLVFFMHYYEEKCVLFLSFFRPTVNVRKKKERNRTTKKKICVSFVFFSYVLDLVVLLASVNVRAAAILAFFIYQSRIQIFNHLIKLHFFIITL